MINNTLSSELFERFKHQFKSTRLYTLSYEGKSDNEVFGGLLNGSGYADVYSAFEVFLQQQKIYDDALFFIQNKTNHLYEDIETHHLYGIEFHYGKDFAQVFERVTELKNLVASKVEAEDG